MKTKSIIPKGYRRLRLGETLEDKKMKSIIHGQNLQKKRVGQTYNPFFTKKT